MGGINHISLNVANIDDAKAFYAAALAPLGYKQKLSLQGGKVLGFGAGFAPDFWLAGPDAPGADGSDVRHTREGPIAGVGAGAGAGAGVGAGVGVDGGGGKTADQKEGSALTGPVHIAFNARNRQQVRDFHRAAIAAGGVCNGTPGTRPVYFATYYGAFVMDPEGRNIEAVCMKPGFWAEPWGFVGWATTGLVLAGAGACYAQYVGLL